MTPEQRARLKIDHHLEQSGWIVQDRTDLDISAGLGVAVPDLAGTRLAMPPPCQPAPSATPISPGRL